MNNTRIFIYGTLKRGFYNNCLISKERFIKEAKTKPEFNMYSMGLGTYPAIVRNEKGRAIIGEIWEVSPDMLDELDYMEGCYGYRRERIELEDGEVAEAYIYQSKLSENEVTTGCWE